MIYLIVKLDCSTQILSLFNKKSIKFEFFANNLYIFIKKNEFHPSNELRYEIMCELSELDLKTLKEQKISQKQILELLINEKILISGMVETNKFFHPRYNY